MNVESSIDIDGYDNIYELTFDLETALFSDCDVKNYLSDNW